MKAHTSEFKNQIKTMGREIDSKITYTLNGVNVELGGEQLNSITPTYQGALLKSVMKELDIDSNVYIPEKTILNYQFGVKVNGEYEYINFGNYVVYKAEKQEDTNSYKLTCYDKMLYSMVDYEKMDITYPISIRDYIKAICNKLGLTFKNANSTFANYDKQIQNELYLTIDGKSLEYTFRDVLDELSQVTASCICINENDELEIRYINETNDTIDEEFLKDINVNFGEKYGAINTIVLSRSADSDNIYYPEILPENPFEFKISDNQIMNFNDRSDYLPDIYEKLNGLEFYINDFSSTGICYYELLDKYNVKIGDNIYSCIMLNDEINITQGLEEKIYTEIPEETETDYTKADKTDRKINQTYLIVDKQNQKIEALIDEIGDRSEKETSITADLDGLKAQVSTLATVSTEAEGTGDIVLENLLNNRIISILIHPTTRDLTSLKATPTVSASKNIFASSVLLTLDGKEKLQYALPTDLLQLNGVYDEFVQDNINKECYVLHRIGIDENGNKYILTEPIKTTYNMVIYVSSGNNKIYINQYPEAYIKAKALIKNDYTTQLATQVYVDGKVQVSEGKVEASVSKKLRGVADEDGNVTSGSIILAINGDTSEAEINADKIGLKANDILDIIAGNEINLTSKNITIASDNFNVTKEGNLSCNNAQIKGKIESNEGTIGGWSINNKGFNNGVLYINSNGFLNAYTYADMIIIQNYILSNITIPDGAISHYDINGDGKVNAYELAYFQKIFIDGEQP